MTVEELIDKLSQLDPLMPVSVEDEMGIRDDVDVYMIDGECVITHYGHADATPL